MQPSGVFACYCVRLTHLAHARLSRWLGLGRQSQVTVAAPLDQSGQRTKLSSNHNSGIETPSFLFSPLNKNLHTVKFNFQIAECQRAENKCFDKIFVFDILKGQFTL